MRVFVTGASSGIGAATARAFAAAGHEVGICARRADRLQQVADECEAQGAARVSWWQADLSELDGLDALAATVDEAMGGVDVLVNNAGVLKAVPLAEHTDALYDQTFDINVRGTFNTLREAATRLNNGGRIINFSSSTVGMNLPGYAVYIASKAAVESLTQVFAKEMRGRQITVNAIAPGPVATELFLHGKSEEQIQTFAKMPPLERLGQPEDIARVVSFLVGPDSAWVNGQILRVNGGLV